jgi:ABC-2 type transport system permease protein
MKSSAAAYLPVSLPSHFRTLRCSAWLGWEIESNWTRPWLFAAYALVKPLTATLLLVCMYWAARAATRGVVTPGYLPFLYVSSALYMLVGGMTFGMSSAVIADREQYGMLKFIRISPIGLQSYFVGRGVSRAVQAGMGIVLALGLGLLLLPELRAALGRQAVDWRWLAVYTFLGSAMLVALGLMLTGVLLNIARHGQFLSEAVAGVLYLLSGVIFPIDALPSWLRPISLALPPTYWLEGMRRALMGPSELSSPLSAWGNGHLALTLGVMTTLLILFAHVFFRWCERRAWRLGRYDQITGY